MTAGPRQVPSQVQAFDLSEVEAAQRERSVLDAVAGARLDHAEAATRDARRALALHREQYARVLPTPEEQRYADLLGLVAGDAGEALEEEPRS